MLAAALAFAGSSLSLSAADREVLNTWDVRNEIKLAPGVNPALVKNYFPSFYEYLDTVLFHPQAGYYSSGRVDFATHYRTFPIALYPSFGHMVAEQIFRMWDGMRKAGTLGPAEKFTIAEFGAGDGSMAESVLSYIDQKAASNPRWREFQQQTVYASYDRSPALSEIQRKRNARFGARFEARLGDAINPGATIPKGSLKGVVLSNELPDCFSVHKVALDTSGSAEIVFVVPSLMRQAWARLERSLPADVRQAVKRDDEAIFEKLLGGRNRNDTLGGRERVYLSKATFSSLLTAFSALPDYASNAGLLQFQEVYVPVTVIPELADHMRQYARAYAYTLAKSGTGMVTYINVDEGKFIRGAGAALKSGYVITIDYGSNWDGILATQFDHLRMFGPGAAEVHANPYDNPTLNDMTTDVNFSHMAEEGKAVGLKALFFGPQHALQVGTPVSLEEPPPGRGDTPDDLLDFQRWAGLFYSWEVYKVLIQQKDNTDPAYRFPGKPEEPLEVSEAGLSAAERRKMADIEKRLRQ